MTEQNSLDKFRSKEVEERFKDLIGGVVNEEFENMNTALDPQPVGCSKDGMECRIRFIKKDWERNQRMQVHGGAVSGMMDTAMGMSIMAKSGRPVTTAEYQFHSSISGRKFSHRYGDPLYGKKSHQNESDRPR